MKTENITQTISYSSSVWSRKTRDKNYKGEILSQSED